MTLEEFTNVRDSAVAILINQLMDGYQELTLPTGKVIHRHPNTVVVFACNTDENQTGELQASTLSRLTTKYYIDFPNQAEMIRRVRNITGFDDEVALQQMASVVVTLRDYIGEHGFNGVCGVREFAGWAMQYQARLCHQIDNVMEDIYVNALQRQMLGGLYAQGINLGNQMIAEDAISINEQKKENYPDIIIVINCLLTLLKANAVYYGKHEAEYKPRVQAIYRIARQHIFRLSHMERCDGINLMMCELWDYVEQMLTDLQKQAQQQASQSSGQQANNAPNGQPLDEETLKKVLNEALKQIQGQTAEAKNCQTSKIAGSQQIKDAQTGEKRKTEIQEQAQDGQLSPTLSQMMEQPAGEFEADLSAGQASAAEGNGQTVYNRDYVPSGAAQAVRTLSEIISDIADERAASVNNAAVSASLQRDISDIDWGSIHKSVNKEINRLAHVPGSYRTTYAFLCRQVQPVVEKLVKTITQTLKEENLTGERRGRFYGKKLDTSRLYRTDLRVWKDRKAPKKEINLAISLLLDESGSMSGSKSEMTRLTAILFAEACEKLNIPLEINGHSTSGIFVELYNYKNFDSVDRNDKFRLVDISARGCNRDGAAVIYGCERLLKRREDMANESIK